MMKQEPSLAHIQHLIEQSDNAVNFRENYALLIAAILRGVCVCVFFYFAVSSQNKYWNFKVTIVLDNMFFIKLRTKRKG